MIMKKLDRLTEIMYTVLYDVLDAAYPETSITPTIQKNHWATEKHLEHKKKGS